MKRAREIDLEAPVRDDDDGEDDVEDISSSVLDERTFSKKFRGMHPRVSETSQREFQNREWPGGLANPAVLDNEIYKLSNRLDVDARRPRSTGIEGEERAKPGSLTAFDAQIFSASDFAESGGQVEQSNNLNPENVILNRNSLGEDCTKKQGIGKFGEQVKTKDCPVILKPNNGTYPFPLALLLYSEGNFQDRELQSIFERQATLLSSTEPNIRIGAVFAIGTLVQFIKEDETRKLVTQTVLQKLWKEEDQSVLQLLVTVLCSLAVMSCQDFGCKDEDGFGWNLSQTVASSLLHYIANKDLRSSLLKSCFKVQIFRTLYLISNAGCSLERNSLAALAKDQLGSTNPRLREWGIQLLVQSIRERNAMGVVERDFDKVRVDLLENVQQKWAEEHYLMHTLLEYARDPYPSVREVVVRGILKLHSKGFALSRSTYMLAFTLLQDSFESVRMCAMKLVGICVKEASDSLEGSVSNYIDNAFMQICNMMTDMSMHVREEACNTLAGMTGVSDGILLQSLSKKVLPAVPDKVTALGSSTSLSDGDSEMPKVEENKVFDWSAAGAFIVGLEDEFWEVRLAALKALAKLGLSSQKMVHGSLELMVDMLNDDSPEVQQQSISALTNFALEGQLPVLEAHLHMVHHSSGKLG